MTIMKERLFLIFSLLALLTGQAQAQRSLPGMKAVRVTADMVDGFYSHTNRHDAGYALGLSVSTYAKDGCQWVFGGEILQRNLPYSGNHIPLAQYTGEGGYYCPVFSTPGKTVFFNAGVSVLAGYETVNRGKGVLVDGASLAQYESFVYGGALTLEAETYLTDGWVLSFHIRERFMWGTASGHFHFQYGIGIKYNL